MSYLRTVTQHAIYMKRILIPLLLLCAVPAAQAQTVLFHTGDSTGVPYRIPALAVARGGDVIAFSDRRYCGGDIGNGRVDIVSRLSSDNGASWGEAEVVYTGTGQGATAGYGDAAVVADRKRRELLLICCSGDVTYFASTPQHHQGIAVRRATYDRKAHRWTWQQPHDVAPLFYDTLFGGRIKGMFVGSGRLCQSKKIRRKKYYRVYAPLCTHAGNYVVYTDDFGRTWQVLGSAEQSCAPQGDEPKCEELPDGSVLLSSRKAGGRYFNVFRYTDPKKGLGAWGEAVDSRQVPGGISNQSGACNGEILLLKARNLEGKRTYVALQSLPAGPGRRDVTIYFKELCDTTDYATPRAFASNWEGAYQVSHTGSAYSTMAVQRDGRVAFFYEEDPGGYQMVYVPLDLGLITGGRYFSDEADTRTPLTRRTVRDGFTFDLPSKKAKASAKE